MRRNFSMSFDPELMEKVDKERGPIPRSAFVSEVLTQYVEFAEAMQVGE